MVHMADLSSGMDSLRRSSVEMTTAMKEIQASSHSISNIMKTVGDIAFQTNILALNAAVEAARAGEAGAGFAVVADEVRSLARHSAEAAQETEKLLEESIKRSEAGARITNLVMQNLEQMVALSAKVDEALRKINEKSCQVDGVVIEISAASQEQSSGLGQISTALNMMEQLTPGQRRPCARGFQHGQPAHRPVKFADARASRPAEDCLRAQKESAGATESGSRAGCRAQRRRS